MTKSIKSLILVLVLYLYIYSPPFKILPFNVSLFFVIPAIIFILGKEKLKYFFSVFKIELLLLSLLCCYSFLFGIIHFEFMFFLNNLLFIIQIIPVGIWIYFLMENITNNFQIDFFKGLTIFLGIIAVIASIISIIGFAFPELGLYFKYDLQKYDEFIWRFQEHRGFGIADELLFSFAIVQGIILILILYTSKNVLLNIFCFLIIAFSIIINARVGLITIVFVPFILFRKKLFIRYLAGVLFLFVLFYFSGLYNIIVDNIEGPLKFAATFFSESSNFLIGSNGEDSNTYDALFGSMFVLPQSLSELIFGSGKNIFVDEANSTDIGYLLLLNFGGLIYISMFVMTALFIFYRLFKSNTLYPLISYVLVFVFIIANLKGLFFAPKPGMKLFMLLYVCFILYNLRHKENENKDILLTEETNIAL